MKKIIAAIITTAMTSTIAHADVNVGIQLGYGHTQGDNTDLLVNNTTLTKNGNVAYGVYLGYEQFMVEDYFKLGAEVSYYYGYNSLNTADGQAGNLSTVPLLITGKVIFPHGFNAFVKAGYSYTNFTGMNINSEAWRPTAAGGVGYKIDNIDIFAQALYISFTNEASNYGIYTLGLGYSF